MAENRADRVQKSLTRRTELELIDRNGDGRPDGFKKHFLWSIYAMPYPRNFQPPYTSFPAIGPEEHEVLDTLALLGERHKVAIYRVRGHASTEGAAQANLELAQRRADIVAEYLGSFATNHPGIDIRVVAEAIVEGLGESEPELLIGDRDHPLNRRVEIEFAIEQIMPEPIDLSDPLSHFWLIDFDQAFSFFKGGGGQIGVGELARLESMDQDLEMSPPPPSKKFFFYAFGFGVDIGMVKDRAARAKTKMGGEPQLTKLDKLSLMAERKLEDTQELFRRFIPPKFTSFLDRIFASELGQAVSQAAGGADWASKTAQERTVDILSGFGLGIQDYEFTDGRFETETGYSFQEMSLSMQFLVNFEIGGTLVLGGSLSIVVAFIWITAPDKADEWAVAVISEAASNFAVLPDAGVTVSLTVSRFNYR